MQGPAKGTRCPRRVTRLQAARRSRSGRSSPRRARETSVHQRCCRWPSASGVTPPRPAGGLAVAAAQRQATRPRPTGHLPRRTPRQTRRRRLLRNAQPSQARSLCTLSSAAGMLSRPRVLTARLPARAGTCWTETHGMCRCPGGARGVGLPQEASFKLFVLDRVQPACTRTPRASPPRRPRTWPRRSSTRSCTRSWRCPPRAHLRVLRAAVVWHLEAMKAGRGRRSSAPGLPLPQEYDKRVQQQAHKDVVRDKVGANIQDYVQQKVQQLQLGRKAGPPPDASWQAGVASVPAAGAGAWSWSWCGCLHVRLTASEQCVGALLPQRR